MPPWIVRLAVAALVIAAAAWLASGPGHCYRSNGGLFEQGCAPDSQRGPPSP